MTAQLTRRAAADLLGVTERRLHTMLRDDLIKSLNLDDVLRAREQRWVTMTDATSILGVNRSRVGQLVDGGRLPCHQAQLGGRRWFRAGQLEVIANARESRRWRDMSSSA